MRVSVPALTASLSCRSDGTDPHRRQGGAYGLRASADGGKYTSPSALHIAGSGWSERIFLYASCRGQVSG